MQFFQFLSLFIVVFLSSLQTAAKKPHHRGWKTVWHDDFSGPHGLPDRAKWKIDTGTGYAGGPTNWGTGEIQHYTRSTKNLFKSNGLLHIRPIRHASGKWTSARIESRRGDFKAKRGQRLKVEARIRIPAVNPSNGAGVWPAFWTLGSRYRGNYTNWPVVGEFDIMENVNGLPSTSATMHCGTQTGGSCNEPIGLGARGPCRTSNCNGNWHTYSVVVDRKHHPEKVSFFADGVLRRRITADEVDAFSWQRAVHDGHYIILNVAMGGNYPNGESAQYGGGQTPTGGTASGKAMKVKYVAVYKQ